MNEKNDNSKKRLRERVNFVVNVLLDIGGNTTYFTESSDISMNGIFVNTDSPPPVGTHGKVTIVLEFGEQKLFVHADCEVIRVADPPSNRDYDSKYGAGLQFTYIDSESSINLYNIIKYQNGSNLLSDSDII